MIKKLVFMMAVVLMSMPEAWANIARPNLTQMLEKHSTSEELTRPLTPTYINGAVIPSWKDNWFINVSGGVSSFLGSPIGCEDLFGRMEPTLQVSLGKWHTPAIGNRVSFQGLKWKSGELECQQYRHWHADLLWNLTPAFNIGHDGCRWDIIPFVGVGLIDNRTSDRRPFAVNYGIQGRFRVCEKLHVTAELGNATTFKDSDGIGSSRQLGDNLLSLSAGLTWTIGKNVGWKKVVDATPYIRQNERLAAYAFSLNKDYNELMRSYNANARVIAELRKILDIEGLLDKYIKCFDTGKYDSGIGSGYPVNDYSGLNSLRKRLRDGEKANGKTDLKSKKSDSKSAKSRKNKGKSIDAQGSSNGNVDSNNGNSSNQNIDLLSGNSGNGSDYLLSIEEDGECLGAPIYFFFNLGTAELVDKSQTVNLNEIARIAMKYGLKIEVTGAADSLTGTEEINNTLGHSRADYIANYLMECGVEQSSLTVVSDGGIDTYTPNEANRNATVRLFLP